MKLLLVVIDAATPHVVCPAIRTGRLPTLQRLADAGDMHEAAVTIFPSITPAATTSIVTGCYPAEHGIAGASWYDDRRQEVAYYGDDFWVIAREGFGAFIRDFLVRLNGDRLKAPTLFEMVERSGRIAACLNYLVYRGIVPHKVRIPGLIATLPGVPFTETVEGPAVLSLGDFVGGLHPDSARRASSKLRHKGGLLHRFGMDDASTGALLKDLFSKPPLPDLTVAYFADNDYNSHEVGPFNALNVVESVDTMLGEAFEAGGGLERVLEDVCVIVTSDHGHCDVIDDHARAVIRVDRLLGNYRQAALGRPWRERDEIMICPNMRAAQIYVRKASGDIIHHLIADVLADPRVDQAMWCTTLTRPGAEGYTVASRRGRVEFRRSPEREVPAVDAFGGAWEWTGDQTALGFHQDGPHLEFDLYPNAFERIAGILDLERSGEIWVTAKPGCEFEVPGGKAHVGGASHGALHKLDSLSPVVIAGGAARPQLPRHLRSIDIAPIIMQMLGFGMRYRPGDPRYEISVTASR
jgi:hypothetical protein